PSRTHLCTIPFVLSYTESLKERMKPGGAIRREGFLLKFRRGQNLGAGVLVDQKESGVQGERERDPRTPLNRY
ncbi:MAG: hypothetical protein KC994_01405, partial [Candidatus Omnitrophica bacterium]|nr:hypothetical protein [Candidatus Omnitrophota bacterium]